MNLSSFPGFSGVRVAQSVVFLWPVIVYVFAFLCDLRINSQSFLTDDPDKNIGLAQRRHGHKLVLAMVLLTNGSLRTITNWRFNLKLLITSYGIFKLFIHCPITNRNSLYFMSTKLLFALYNSLYHGVRINSKWWCFYQSYIIRNQIYQVYNVFFSFKLAKLYWTEYILLVMQTAPLRYPGLVSISKHL